MKFIDDKSVLGIGQTKLTMTMAVILKMAMLVTVTMMVMRVFFKIIRNDCEILFFNSLTIFCKTI